MFEARNPFALPTSSFNQPITPPSTDPDEEEQWTVCFGVAWLTVVLGALDQLLLPSTWIGDADAIQEAQDRSAVLKDLFGNPTCTSGGAIETPYWDDVADADDETTPEEQTWYGEYVSGTFTEVVENWVIAGFIASSGNLNAAIAFLTIAPKFRLAFKTGDIGGIIRIFVDANDYGTIDTNAAEDGIIYKDIVADPEADTHQIYVVLDSLPSFLFAEDVETAAMVIRKVLSPDEITPPNIRYSGDPPVFQQTTDGGSTWVDSPEGDPRYNPAYLLPPLTPYSGIQCDGAARLTAQLKDTLDIFIASADAFQFATSLLAVIFFPIGIVGWILDAILFVANLLIDTGQSTISAAFTSGVYDDIQCIFSCYVDANGQISQSSLDAAYEQIKTAHAGTVATVIDELRLIYGDVPMNNAIASRTDTGDCSGCASCAWYVEFDFSAGSSDHFHVFADSSYIYGGYTGAAWHSMPTAGIQELLFYCLMAGVHITGISFYGTQLHGTGSGHTVGLYDLVGSPSLFSHFSLYTSGGITDFSSLGWHTLFTPALDTTDGFGIYWVCSSNGSGAVDIQKIRIGGTGTPPAIGRRVSGLS